MFSYCKKAPDSKLNRAAYDYQMSPLQTYGGFGKPPTTCKNLNVPYVSNRGIPRRLIDTEAALRGQGREYQPFCSDPCEGRPVQFSMLQWLTDVPTPKIGQPIPCASPSPIFQVRGGAGCQRNHCGELPPGCLEDRNMTRPHVGVLDYKVEPACRY